MANDIGAHDSRDFETGELVHLGRPPGGKWHITSYEWSLVNGQMLWNLRVFAETLGWQNLDFETTEAAYAFVKEQLKEGKIPTKVAQQRAAFSEWLARQHLQFDSRLTEVIYLPAGAPEKDVRLLEVNTGLYPEPGNPITPIEMTSAITDLPFRVLVADVTPEEWNQIKTNPALLPTGWNLEGNRIFRRMR